MNIWLYYHLIILDDGLIFNLLELWIQNRVDLHLLLLLFLGLTRLLSLIPYVRGYEEGLVGDDIHRVLLELISNLGVEGWTSFVILVSTDLQEVLRLLPALTLWLLMRL